MSPTYEDTQDLNIKDIKKTRKKRRRKIQSKRLTGIAVVVAGIVLFLAFLNLLSSIPVIDMVKTNFTAMQDTSEFPLKIDGEKQYELFWAKNYIGIKSDTNIILYDKNGKYINTAQTGMDNPVVKCEGDNILYYTVGGSIVYIKNIYKTTSSIDIGKPIMKADIAKNGEVAVIYVDSNNFFKAGVFLNNEENVFGIKSDADAIIDNIKISKDGKEIFLVTAEASKAELISKMSLYSMSKDEPKVSIEIIGSKVFSIDKKIKGYTIVCNNKILFYDNEFNLLSEFNYDKRIVTAYYSDDITGVIVGLSDHGANTASQIYCFNDIGEEQFNINVDTSEYSLYYDKNIYIKFEDSVKWYSKEGEALGEYFSEEKSKDFLLSGNMAYVLSVNKLDKINLSEYEFDKK